jgi:mannose-1-phosphate guanylyltransferase
MKRLVGLVLAAGKGTRLHTISGGKPKVLVPIGGVPILGWILRLLREHGLRQARLSISLQDDITLAAARQAVPDGMTFDVPLGQTEDGTLREALRIGQGLDTMLVYYGDTITDLPIDSLMAAHRRNRALGALATIVYYRPADLAEPGADGRSCYGILRVSSDGRIIEFREKPVIG